jgi:enoyl-CoA hydratase/carnithine racemase
VSAGSGNPELLTQAQVVDRLRSPRAAEEFSPVAGESLLAVDFEREGVALAHEAVAAACEVLARLPCPSIALSRGRPRSAAAQALLDGFDVVVADEQELEALAGAVGRRPLASAALVQLLRHNAKLDLCEGLVAESLVYSTLQSGPEFAAWLAARGPVAPPETSSQPAVRVEREKSRLTLTLNRPERHNALSCEIRDALVEALELVVADTSIREVRLRGAGSSFCSGGDLTEFGTLPDPATAHLIRSTRSPARLLAACGDRVRADLHGACVGAGIELPAYARRVVAREDAFFELPEVSMGLVPGAGGTASLPRRIGRQRTAWLALSGRRLEAATALRWGLVDELR